MSASIRVRCTRGMMFRGEHVETGAVLALSPLEAFEATASGRAVLVDPADAKRVDEAAADDRDRMLRKLHAERRHAEAQVLPYRRWG